MKIAFFCYLPLEYGGGTARFFLDAAEGLKKHFPDLDPYLITLDDTLASKITALYSFYFQRNVSKELRKSISDLKLQLAGAQINYLRASDFATLRKAFSEFDTVYAKNDILEAFILKFIAGQSIKKLVYGFHTPIHYEQPGKIQDYVHNFLYNSSLYKNLIFKAAKFHVLNEYDKLLLKKYFKKKTVRKIYNPFDFKSFGTLGLSNNKQSPFKSKKVNILWIGRLTREKGADDLIQLITEMNKTKISKGIIWNIVGAGSMRKEIKSLMEKYKNVNYFGYKSREELAMIYNSADIFVSTSKWESFPYTFVEAQCFGLPIISYDIHGCNEIIKNGLNGYLADSFSEMRKKLIHLIGSKNKIMKRETIKKNIRKLINSELIYKDLYELLR